MDKWNFRSRVDKYLVLGWVVTSMLSGALDWRPSAWITGATTCGKSTLLDDVITPLTSAIGGQSHSQGSTAAGIRQGLGHRALPIIIDEMESDDAECRKRVDQLISMVRGASSNQGATVTKGTSGGQAISYLLRSSFLFASIDVGLEKEQDKNRIIPIYLNALTPEMVKDGKNTLKLCSRITPELSRRLLRHAVDHVDQIEATAVTLMGAIIDLNQELGIKDGNRIAKVKGLMLAAGLSLMNGLELEMSEDDAKGWVNDLLRPFSGESTELNDEHNNSAKCLQYLLNYKIRAVRYAGSGDQIRRENCDITVQQAIDDLYRKRCRYDEEELHQQLHNNGLKITQLTISDKKQDYLCVANGGAALDIFKPTQWRDHKEALRRIGADGIAINNPIYFGSKKQRHRATAFALSDLCEDVAAPMPTVINGGLDELQSA